MPALDSENFNGRCPRCLAHMTVVSQRTVPSIAKTDNKMGGEIVIVVDNLRSAYNVGAILRTAECFGVSQVYLCGITPSADNDAVRKTSVGAWEFLEIRESPNLIKTCDDLRQEGFEIWALELAEGAVSVRDLGMRPAKLALVVGNERCGVDGSLLEAAERIIYIPMSGNKNSLNVEVSFGIAMESLVKLNPE